MQKDCHFFVTYVLARKADFSHKDAKHIAWAAQTVDEMDVDKLREQALVKVESSLKSPDNANFYKNPNIKELKNLYKKKIDDYFHIATFQSVDYLKNKLSYSRTHAENFEVIVRYVWSAFHFLPISSEERGEDDKCYLDNEYKNSCKSINEKIDDVTDANSWNLPLIVTNLLGVIPSVTCLAFAAGAVNQIFELLNKDEYKKKVMSDRYFICHHTTKMCSSMITNALNYKNGSRFSESGGAMCVLDEDSSIEKKRALYLIGICMHVLADTWSHENFCGSNDMFINHVKVKKGVPCSIEEPGPIGLGIVADGVSPLSSLWVGHGAAGTNPDIPGNNYTIERTYFGYTYDIDNKERFKDAFREMLSALKFLNGLDRTSPLDNLTSEETTYINNLTSGDAEKIAFGKIFESANDSEETRCNYVKDYIQKVYKESLEESLDYNINDSEEDTELFMTAAKDHRRFVMKKLDYAQGYLGNNKTLYDYEKCVDSYLKNELADDNKGVEAILQRYENEKKAYDEEQERLIYKMDKESGRITDQDELDATSDWFGGFAYDAEKAHKSCISSGMFQQEVDPMFTKNS